MKKLFLMLLATVSLIACNNDNGNGGDPAKPIELTEGTTNSQTVFADETQKAIKFTATAPWTATVNAVAVNKAGDDVQWIALSATEGKAGENSISLTILPNTSGADRKAEIRIVCAGTTITVAVEQKATIKPEDPNAPKPLSNFVTAQGKITGGEILADITPVELRWQVSRMDGYDPESATSPVTVPYINKNFDLTFPTPQSNVMGEFMSSGASIKPAIIPADTKFTGGNIDCMFKQGNELQETELHLTNIAIENMKKDDDYLVKKGEGSVRFVYASKEAVVDGQLKFRDDDETYKFSNCKFRAGWNEMMMVADADALAGGKVTYNVTINNATSDFKWVALEDETGTVYYGPVVKVESKTKITYLTGSPDISTYSYDIAYAAPNMPNYYVSSIGGINIGYAEDKITFIGGKVNITANLNSRGLIVSQNGTIGGFKGLNEYEYKWNDVINGEVLSKMTQTTFVNGKTAKRIYDLTFTPRSGTISGGGNYTKIVRSYYVDANDDGVFGDDEQLELEVVDIEYNTEVSNHWWPDISAFCFSAVRTLSFSELFNLAYVSRGYGKASVNLPSKVTSILSLTNSQMNNRDVRYFEYAMAKGCVVKANITGFRDVLIGTETSSKTYDYHSTLDFIYDFDSSK